MDRENIREQVLHAYPQGPDAVATLVVTLVSELSEQVANLMSRVAALETANATLRTEVATLRAANAVLKEENATLQARFHTDSHNSSKPPSSDGYHKPSPKSQRTSSGRKTGGQPGHPGHRLSLIDDPDEIVVHAPPRCPTCHEAFTPLTLRRQERRQIVDIPPVRRRVIEHQVETHRCSRCGTEAHGEFPAEMRGPIQYGPGVAAIAVYLNQEQLLPSERTCAVLGDLFACPIAEGTLESMVANCHEQLAETEAQIKAGVTHADIVHFDETGVHLQGKTSWLHVACTPVLTFYASHAKRGRDAFAAIDVLPHLTGRAVHDGWESYQTYAQVTHALCNAHHLRELTFVEEELGQPWAKDLKDVLRAMKEAVDQAKSQGQEAVEEGRKCDLRLRYDTVLSVGEHANPLPEMTGKRGRPKRGKARSLVERLQKRKAQVLAFLEDFTVPFDNNQAERDLRMVKVQQKISGCFRTTTGAERFCRIRGYVSTMRKQGLPIFSALAQAISGNPPLPAFAA